MALRLSPQLAKKTLHSEYRTNGTLLARRSRVIRQILRFTGFNQSGLHRTHPSQADGEVGEADDDRAVAERPAGRLRDGEHDEHQDERQHELDAEALPGGERQRHLRHAQPALHAGGRRPAGGRAPPSDGELRGQRSAEAGTGRLMMC